jgi:hypothetical protein
MLPINSYNRAFARNRGAWAAMFRKLDILELADFGSDAMRRLAHSGRKVTSRIRTEWPRKPRTQIRDRPTIKSSAVESVMLLAERL